MIKDVRYEKKHIVEMILIIISALVPLMICSKSSPLYPFNDWPDVNIFMTVGKGMVRGEIPYVDLLDHKGPYMYALAAVSYLIAPGTFYGYFIFEALSYIFFMYYALKIIRLYTEGNGLWILSLIGGAVASSKSFVHGGSLEELSIGIFAYAIYGMLTFLHSKEEKMSTRCILINGIWAGILLGSKYTLLGLYIAWAGTVVLIYFFRKQYKEMFKAVGIFLGAMLVTMIPWLIYFIWHHALEDWFLVYVWNNITGYAAMSDASLVQKVINAVLDALRSLKDVDNRRYSIPLVVGCIAYVFNRKVFWSEKLAVAFMGLGMAVGIFIGETKHDYYGFPLAVFTIFGGVLVAQFWEILLKKRKGNFFPDILRFGMFGVVLVVAAVGSYHYSPNTYLMSVEREEMPQYRFAEIIELSEDTTLLNYSFLDGGFYTVLDQIPMVKEFCLTNMEREATLQIQNEYLQQQLTNWVVTWRAYPMLEEELQKLPVVSEYYELVDYQYFYFEGDMRTYALYKRK